MKTNTIIISVLLFSAFVYGCATHADKPARIVDLGNGICQDTVTGIMWQKGKSNDRLNSIDEARNYVKNLRLGNYNDWRLPTIYELYELHFLIDTHQKTECAMELEGNFWADKKDGDGLVGAWEIGDQCEPEREYFEGNKGYVRAVRQ